MERVYISLGGNEGEVVSLIHQACQILSSSPGIFDVKLSRLYSTSPVNMQSPNWFVNAVSTFETSLDLPTLFQFIQDIEKKLGKTEKPKYSNRPIDLDLLFYGQKIYKDHTLEIPHPRWKERLFVLIPLSDLTSHIVLHSQNLTEQYVLDDLIQSFPLSSSQLVSLLEKNPKVQ